MVDVDRLCRGCMRPLDTAQRRCPVCGYDNAIAEERSAKCLPEHTILQGRYLLGRVLGEGGFGVTYLALDLTREEPVAIKEYFPVGLASRDMETQKNETLLIMPGELGMYYRDGLRRFAQEGEHLARFQGLPGIVTARDFFQANGTAYLVMDYIEGQSLKQYMQWYMQNSPNNEPIDYHVALAFMEPVIRALAEIHKAGLIHRDISPDNILVDRDGQVKLIDFGAARMGVRPGEFKSMTVMVKRGYAPEEQYRTHGQQGPWTDVYALCATLYHMISGILPADSVERMYEDTLAPLKALSLAYPVPEAISDVLEKGMALRASDRYQDMEELSTALAAAQAAGEGGPPPRSHAAAPESDQTMVLPSPAAGAAPRTGSVAPAAPSYPSAGSAPELSHTSASKNKIPWKIIAVVVFLAALLIAAVFAFGRPKAPEDTDTPATDTVHTTAPVQTSEPAQEAAAAPSPTPTPVPSPTAVPITLAPYDGQLSQLSRLRFSRASASSYLSNAYYGTFPASLAIDGHTGTAWQEGVSGYGVGESLTLYFSEDTEISVIEIYPGFAKSEYTFYANGRPSSLQFEFSDGTMCTYDFDDVCESSVLELSEVVTTSYIRLTILGSYDAEWQDTAISEVCAYR